MSEQPERNPKWQALTSFPFIKASQQFATNNNEFIVIASTGYQEAMYKYNTHKNEWMRIFTYDIYIHRRNVKCRYPSAAYDNKNQLFYIGNRDSKILSWNAKTKTVKNTETDVSNFVLIYVKNKLHQISERSHYIYEWGGICHKITPCKSTGQTIFLKRQNQIILFDSSWNSNDSIYRFSCDTEMWNELTVKMPTGLTLFGLVSCCNDRYILILGGNKRGYGDSQDIFIYDQQIQKIFKSKAKCPTKGLYHALIINNSEKICYGFMNECYKEENFVISYKLPCYLVQIIICYFYHEEIYLLNKRGTGKYWKINVDYILH
eukprot:136743_1